MTTYVVLALELKVDDIANLGGDVGGVEYETSVTDLDGDVLASRNESSGSESEDSSETHDDD